MAAQTPAPRRQRDTGPTRTVREIVKERAGGRCEWPGCAERGCDVQHRLGRKIGGRFGEMAELLNGPAWLLFVCRPHHQGVTSATGEALTLAKASGWVLEEGQDAAVVPVRVRWWDAPVLLDGEGCWSAAA